MAETLRVQREESQRFQRLQTETQFIAAHQLDQQSSVLRTAANNLGEMSTMNLGTGGGFNPVGMMTGLAVGGVMGGQMAGMMNSAGAAMTQPPVMPPPLPQVQYSVNINGQTSGPFMLNQLQELARSGQLTPATYVWKPGMANWDSAGNVAELVGLFAAAPPPPPPPPPLPPAAPAL
jgi:hypothetical protein